MEQEVQKRIRENVESKAGLLDLNDCGLSEIPKEVFSMLHIKTLRISNNRFFKNKNAIRLIPKEIANLKDLIYLDLCGNEIVEIPQEVGELKELFILDLSDNNIKRLPIEISQLSNLKALYLEGNPIEKPPYEIVKQGLNAIDNYYKELQKGISYLQEAKLIIVGYGAVGKTTLMRKLTNTYSRFHESVKTTEGIDIKQWNFICKDNGQANEFRANIWDFGGQEIYKTTHQFFLTKRSLYLFVWNARMDERYDDFAYWLNIVKLLSASSPVIIIMNKLDERDLNIDEFSLKQEFNNIVGFYKVSCKDGTNIDALISKIKDELLKLPHIGVEWPKPWADVRYKLENDPRDYIDYTEYKEICLGFGVNTDAINTLSQYLHDLGIILHFVDDPVLLDTVILKPEWGTSAVYRVLDTRKIFENHGEFSFKDLRHIWESYPSEKYKQLLQLMIKFELCFQIVDSNNYIIPQLLPAQMPEEIKNWPLANSNSTIRFEYRYKFLPEGIVTRFICRNHKFIENNYIWKNGVMLKFYSTYALIFLVEREKIIKVYVKGDQSKELLFTIRKEFMHIHSTLSDLKVSEMIPCICQDCKDSDNPYFFNYDALLRFKNEKKKKEKECDRSGESVSIDALIDGTIQNGENTTNLKEEILKLTNILTNLQKEFQDYRDKTTNNDDNINRIYQKLNELTNSPHDRNKLEKNLLEWIPNLQKLRSDSFEFMVRGEYLAQLLNNIPIEFHSICILQFCLSVECELSKTIFDDFKIEFIGKVNSYDLSSRDSYLETFAKYINDPKKNITLGNIGNWVKLITSTKPEHKNSILITRLREYLTSKKGIKIEKLDYRFADKVRDLSDNYRNLAAHTNGKLIKDNIQPCKDLVKNIFAVWISSLP